MDFSYTEDQQALRELARKILEDRVTHDRQKEILESETRLDREVWSELAKSNLLGLTIDEVHGGSGLGLTELAILLEELGRVVAPVPAYATLVLGALPLQAFGSDAQKAKWLPQVAQGDAILSGALLASAQGPVTATPDGDGWRLDGQLPLVPAAGAAARVLVPARSDAGATLWLLLDPAEDGVTATRVETTDQQYRFDLALAGARISADDVLGDPARGEEISTWIQERALLALCALQVGIAERALEITAGYVTERKQFDRPVGSFQAVHTRAGDAFVDLQGMRLTLWRSLHLLEHGEPAAEALTIAKYWAAEGGARITYAAQHLHGGIGVDIDYPVHRYYLWGRQVGMELGSGAQQLAALGAAIAAA